eukprot:Amastigsp_a340845_249.p3 type:complete len:146 gc:universal Amastigsp_a340845_249:488-51(-)
MQALQLRRPHERRNSSALTMGGQGSGDVFRNDAHRALVSVRDCHSRSVQRRGAEPGKPCACAELEDPLATHKVDTVAQVLAKHGRANPYELSCVIVALEEIEGIKRIELFQRENAHAHRRRRRPEHELSDLEAAEVVKSLHLVVR